MNISICPVFVTQLTSSLQVNVYVKQCFCNLRPMCRVKWWTAVREKRKMYVVLKISSYGWEYSSIHSMFHRLSSVAFPGHFTNAVIKLIRECIRKHVIPKYFNNYNY